MLFAAQIASRRLAPVGVVWPELPQADFLAPEGYTAVYETNAITKHGEHGNALLTRWPVLRKTHQDISDHRFEQRGLLHVAIDLDGRTVHTIVVHLGLIKGSRIRQIAQLREFVEREIPPGLFGENLRTTGVDVTGAVTGERWRIGETLELEVAPRRTDVPGRSGGFETRWLLGVTAGALFEPETVTPGPLAALGDATPADAPPTAVLVSDAFHMLRLGVLARRHGIAASTSPAPASPCGRKLSGA